MQDHIYCPVTSREETSLLVSDSTIQGLHIKQENRVRGTFTLPLVNTPTPDQNTRPAGGQTSSAVATDTHAVLQDVISQEKRVWPWRSWVGWFLPCERCLCRRSLLYRCVRNMFYHIYAFFFLPCFCISCIECSIFPSLPLITMVIIGPYQPVFLQSDISPVPLLVYPRLNCLLIHLVCLTLRSYLSHLSSFHLYFSLLIFVHQSQIFAYNVHGNDRVCKSFQWFDKNNYGTCWETVGVCIESRKSQWAKFLTRLL